MYRDSFSMVFIFGLFFATADFSIARDSKRTSEAGSATAVAAEVDQIILAELRKAKVEPAGRSSDDDFLRRVSLDITGQLPTPEDVIAFRKEADVDKRSKLIDKMIDSPQFGWNWARYWRDVIYVRATEQRSRFNQEEFTTWMADQWNKGIGWNFSATSMLTATGNVEEHPETALIFAQGANSEEVAAEACRVFLGIQLQCANCHDHPSDIWKREQFHQLAAYFPRISEKRTPGPPPVFEIVSVNTENKRGEFMREHPELFVARFDRNNDHRLSKEELKSGPVMRGKKAAANMNDGKLQPQMIERLFDNGDTNKDGFLSIEEIRTMPAPQNMRRGSTEHHMVDLKNPAAQGELIDPKFFVDGSKLPHGLTDEERRRAVAKSFTSPDNPWFARAFVNRIWAEMLGEGFYIPIDDIGPTRSARYPEALEVLCQNFVKTGHDPKWLVRTIANTQAYQHSIQPKSTSAGELPFAAATPIPLRSDTIFNSLMQVFGVTESEMGGRPKRIAEAKESGEMKDAMEMEMKDKEKKDRPRAFLQSPRFLFNALFGNDPSVPKDEISANIPQSLMMMNSRKFRAGMSAKGETRLAKILSQHKTNDEALGELYLLILARDPSTEELNVCRQYIDEVKSRPEAFEDVMWSLLNSSEFVSKR